jgi:hypothetical protein
MISDEEAEKIAEAYAKGKLGQGCQLVCIATPDGDLPSCTFQYCDDDNNEIAIWIDMETGAIEQTDWDDDDLSSRYEE